MFAGVAYHAWTAPGMSCIGCTATPDPNRTADPQPSPFECARVGGDRLAATGTANWDVVTKRATTTFLLFVVFAVVVVCSSVAITHGTVD